MWIDQLVTKKCTDPLVVDLWIPTKPCVVLGSTNHAALEVNEEYCTQNNIEVLKRTGGGGTVVLYPGCVVMSIGAWVKQFFMNQHYFNLINQSVIACIEELSPKYKNLILKGISDIAINDKKICGTSLYRSRHYLLYQASLIVDLDIPLIENCLKHPTREPDYRGKRSHKDFLTSLSAVDAISPEQVLKKLSSTLQNKLMLDLKDELLETVDEKEKVYIFNR